MLSATAAEDPRHLEVIGQCLGLRAGGDFPVLGGEFWMLPRRRRADVQRQSGAPEKLHHCIFPERDSVSGQRISVTRSRNPITADPTT